MVMKGYKQTEVGVIPEDWADKKLGDVGKVCMCKRIFADQTSDIGEVPFFKIGTFGKEADAYISKDLYEDYKRRFSHPQKGDVLISAAGTLGRSLVFNGKDAYFQDSNIVWLDIDKDQLCNEYLYHYYKVIKWAFSEGSTIARLYNGIIRNTHIVLPDREEQKQIAAVLSEMDELISLTEKRISKEKAIKQGAMQELLTGKRRLPGFSGEWETMKLEDYCTLITKQTGFDYSAYIKPALITRKMPNTLPMIQTINFHGRKFAFETDYYIPKSVAVQFPNIILDKKCVLFSIVGASVGNVGLYPGSITAFCGGAIGITRFRNEQDAEWVYNYMSSPDGQSQIQYVTKGGAQATVTIADIRNFKIPTPEKGERDAISGILGNMDYEIEALEQELKKYRQVKQGMMQQLLTGKIRLKNDVEDLVQAEQADAVKTLPARTAHNHQFDDAVSIAAIVDTFYSDKYPLGRVKVQKLLYLLHRHQSVSVSDFKKKAAGPYADAVRYKGGEPIAIKNKYVVSESGKQGTRYARGANIAQALNYVERWGMQTDLQWLKENFLHTSRNDLELFATVDMAMSDLAEAGISASVESIKNLIASNKEWKAKLSKTYFSDRDIARAIKKCTDLFD